MASLSGKNEKLKERFQTILQTVEPPLTTECCIFRVPKVVRKTKESAYTPSVISIGPFHHKSDELQYMEGHKVRYVNQTLSVHKVNLDDLLSMVKDLEKRIRICYGEYIDLSCDDLVMMVVLDGVFIIEYFRRCYFHAEMNIYGNVPLYAPKVEFSIRNDLILLENQLPFFVLDKIYNLVYRLYTDQPSFLKISCNFFSNLQKQEILPPPSLEVLHFTDLIRKLHLPPIMELDHLVRNHDVKKHISLYSAKELAESGIKFRTDSRKCLLDIELTLTNRVFLIPQLTVDDNTESMFRNMMALEQYVYPYKMYICDYAMLMDTLIDTSKDVELLARTHIVVNRLGDHEEVAALFNNLNRGILYTPGRYYFNGINQELDNYCKEPWHRWKASFKRDYLSSPWKIASVAAAIVLLLLTLIQTFCSILQVLPHGP